MKLTNEVMSLIEQAYYDGWNKGYSFVDNDRNCLRLTAEEGLELFKSENNVLTCCSPTEEELKLLNDGDCTPEELWGGRRPTCPNCI